MSSKIIYSFVLVFLFAGLGFAQDNMGSWSVFAGVSLPSGDFGDNNAEGDGYATTGFGAGIDYNSPLGTPGLTWFSTAAFLYNGFDDQGIVDLAESGGLENPKVDAGSWMNIPILTGLKYGGAASPTMNYFVFGQIGIDFVLPPDADITASNTDDRANLSFDSATSFTFGFGGGLAFNNNINVAFRYLTMGEPKIEGDVTVSGEQVETLKENIAISVILLTVGINL